MQSYFGIDAELEESVPLNEQDRAWIRQAIDSAYKAHGWGTLTRYIKEWGGTGAAVAILILALTQWTAYVEFRTNANASLASIKDDLRNMHTDLSGLRHDVDVLQIQHSTAVLQPKSGATPKDIGEAASDLRKEGVTIPRPPVAETARALLQTASYDPSGTSWNALSQMLEYISFLNKQSSPIQTLIPFHGKGTFIEVPHGWTGHYAWFGSSTYPVVPQFHPIGFGLDSNESIHEGPAFLVMSGAPLQLDGEVIKRVVFIDVEVIYDGGPLQMENVYFVNCTFKIKPTPRSKNLAIAMLSQNAATTFSGE
jgi:hypothetical protein